MIEKLVSLNTVEKVKRFSDVVSNFPYEITLTGGEYTVDAKSIMSIFTLDLEKPLRMTAHCDTDSGMLSDISEFVI